MASRKHERRRAREAAVALLYSGDITERDVVELVESGSYPDEGIAVSDYAEMLVNGVSEHLADIDARLASTSENWAVDRMPMVDRAILRVAVFEMEYVDAVPVSVAINEAVEIAKLYGGEDDSSRFVNGVLGRISRLKEAAPQEAADPEDAAAPQEPAAAGDVAARLEEAAPQEAPADEAIGELADELAAEAVGEAADAEQPQ